LPRWRSRFDTGATLVNTQWKKSSRCESNGCAEVATTPDGMIHIRSSLHPEAPVTVFTRDEWAVFLEGVKLGDFDL